MAKNKTFESVTVAGTAIGGTAGNITSTTYGRARKLLFSMESTNTADQIRFRYDGTSPTASEGHLLSHGDFIVLDDFYDIRELEAIGATGYAGTIKTKWTYSY